MAGCHPGEASHLNTLRPSTMQTRKAGSMLTAGIFSEACDISKRHKKAKKVNIERARLGGKSRTYIG